MRFLRHLTSSKRRLPLLIGGAYGAALLIGVALGSTLAGIRNFDTQEELDVTLSALPTQLFDIKGRLITEFFSDEKREIVSLDEVPRNLINAVLTREDHNFYHHHGLDSKRILSAALGYFTGAFRGGGSTLTIQVAGNKFADRRQYTIRRKLKEFWYAKLLEMRYAKDEILEFYLNEMPFGGGTNGVEAASQYYFRKSVRDISLAEAVLLVNVLASHTRYSPLKNPETARERQKQILDEMVRLGYTTREAADVSFEEYWNSYDFTRYASYGAFSEREDKAPWFSEYVRVQLEDMLLGSQDIYRSGLKVYTTLDLDYQKIADEVMDTGIKKVNDLYREQTDTRARHGDATFVPLVEMLASVFDLGDVKAAGSRQRSETERIFNTEMGPVMDLVSTMFDIQELKKPAQISAEQLHRQEQKNIVEGALVCLDSRTGYMYAVVGGSRFSSTNQFNRAVQGGLQPGSSFKPLYYSAAIEQRKVTPATMIMDRPSVFWNDDGTPYVPLNFRGEWQGRVSVREALAKSMNVPSLKVLEAVGFDAAIERASRMLGVTDRAEIEADFPRKYPLGLGVCSVSPLEMARAFATFANQGRGIEPIAIRYVQDRDGKTILEPEREALARMRRPEAQIMSPQTAYVMTDILRDTVRWGTLAYASWKVGGFDDIPIAGKTGTTQNWSDAWTIGFTPRITTAIWFGFDTPGNSLGLDVTGATAAGPVWAEFMKRAQGGLPKQDFAPPLDGVARVTVSQATGMLPTPGEKVREEVFLAGTEPRTFSDLPKKEQDMRRDIVENLRSSLFQMSFDVPASGAAEQPNVFDQPSRRGTASDTKNPLLE